MAKEEVQTVSSGGIGIAGILTIIFVIMKCLGHLSWSWLWVFSPLWISAALGIGIIVIVLTFIAIVALVAYIASKQA